MKASKVLNLMENKGGKVIKLLAILLIFVLFVNSKVNFFKDNFDYEISDEWVREEPQFWSIRDGKLYFKGKYCRDDTVIYIDKDIDNCEVEVELEFKVKHRIWANAGIIVRFDENSRNGYKFVWYPERNIVRLQDKNKEVFIEKRKKIGMDRVYKLKVRVEDDAIKCYIDGEEIIFAENLKIFKGKVGLIGFKADVLFDNFKVYPLAQKKTKLKSPINSSVSWYKFIGTHYSVDSPLKKWIGIVRGAPYPGSWGMTLDITDKKKNKSKYFIGKFSGEKRFYDFERIEKEIKKLRKKGILVLPVLGPGAGSLVDKIREKNGIYWKDCVYEQVKYFNSGDFKDYPLLYWQVGNEINSITHFNIEKIKWSGSPWRYFNRLDRIPAYVELFFAPAVEAIEKASEDIYGDPDKIKVVLGSIANYYNPKSQRWLEELLNTEIKGERAKSLKGDKVWQHVDIISIHYLVSSARFKRLWRPALDYLYNKWILTKKIEGIWATEEHGASGYGMSEIPVISFRWLDWWSRHKWNCKIGKCIFWGDSLVGEGLPGVYAEGLIGNYLEDKELINLTDNLEIIGKGIEGYAFKTKDGKKILFSFFSNKIPEGEGFLEEVFLKQKSLKDINIFACKINSKNGITNENIKYVKKTHGLEIKINKNLKKMDVLLIFCNLSKESYDWENLIKKFRKENRVLSKKSEIISMQPGNGFGFCRGGIDSGMQGDEDVLIAYGGNKKEAVAEIDLLNDYRKFSKVKIDIQYAVNRVYPEKIVGKVYWDDKYLADLKRDKNFLSIEVSNKDFDFSKGTHRIKLVANKTYYWVAIDALKITGKE